MDDLIVSLEVLATYEKVMRICGHCGATLMNGDVHVKAAPDNRRGLKCLVLMNLNPAGVLTDCAACFLERQGGEVNPVRDGTPHTCGRPGVALKG